MALFLQIKNNLDKIKELKFSLEKEIQELVERNLGITFNLKFLKSEFSLDGLRIDTLAYNQETKSFVIIEYKKDQNFSVVDQGYAYLSLLVNKKADFILEYNDVCNDKLRKEEIDWSQSKVIFISPSFSKYQQKAIHFRDLPFELWEIKKYENGVILFNQLRTPESSESISKISGTSDIITKVSQEVKIYTEEDHLQGVDDEIKELYEELKTRILNLDEIVEIKPRQWYIGFIKNTNFVDVHLQRGRIKLWLNLVKGELDDPRKIARLMVKEDGSKIGHWGNGDYEIYFSPNDDIDYLMTLIRQSYKKHI